MDGLNRSAATRVGAIADGEGRFQYNWASSVSRNLDEKWGVFGELSGTSRSAVTPQAQLMAGATYNWSKRVLLSKLW